MRWLHFGNRLKIEWRPDHWEWHFYPAQGPDGMDEAFLFLGPIHIGWRTKA